MKSFETFELFKLIKSELSYFDDQKFDRCLYSDKIIKLSNVHWTPIQVALLSAEFLTNDISSPTILDIGSGVGKFCTIASLTTNANYTGVEIREELFSIANRIASDFRLERVFYLKESFLNIDFSDYSGFYFYNSFAENIFVTSSIDRSIELSEFNYYLLTKGLKDKLQLCKPGTKLVTYCSSGSIIPENFKLVSHFINNTLRFWICE